MGSSLVDYTGGWDLGKFLQVDVLEVPYLIVGAKDRSARHRLLFERFLREKEIPFEEVWLHGNFGPAKENPGHYSLVGAGHCYGTVGRGITLMLESEDYRIGANADHAQRFNALPGLDRGDTALIVEPPRPRIVSPSLSQTRRVTKDREERKGLGFDDIPF